MEHSVDIKKSLVQISALLRIHWVAFKKIVIFQCPIDTWIKTFRTIIILHDSVIWPIRATQMYFFLIFIDFI